MTYLASFLEGIITFISPRLLPMLPIYLAYFAGGERLDSGATKSLMAEILARVAFYAGRPNAWAAFKMAKEDAMSSERQDELEHGLVDAANGLAVVVGRRVALLALRQSIRRVLALEGDQARLLVLQPLDELHRACRGECHCLHRCAPFAESRLRAGVS